MPGGLTLLASLNANIPTPAAGKATIFFSLDSGVPSYKNDAGVVHSLVGAAGITGATGPAGPAIPLLYEANEIEPMMILGTINSGGFTSVLDTGTGAKNNWDPGILGNTIIFWSGASILSVTGFTGGSAGQLIIFRNTGASLATFANQSGSSSAGHKLLNKATSAVTPVGIGGFAVWQHNGTDWVLINNDSQWITPTFSAGDFTGSGSLTVTVDAGDVNVMRYRLVGNTLQVRWSLISISTGGLVSTSILISNAQWGGFSIAGGTAHFQPVNLIIDAGAVASPGRIRTDSTDATHIVCQTIIGANWSNLAVNNTSIYGDISFEVT